MNRIKTRRDYRDRRHRRLRQRLFGTAARPRMSVCCTDRHIYVQFIDDEGGHTLASASTLTSELRGQSANRPTVEGARRLGQLAASRAIDRQIREVVFDRGGFRFHGRVRAVAEAAREAGLKF